MPFRVRLLGRVSFWPRRLVRSSAESTTGEISLAFGHAMEVRLSRRLRSGVPPFTPYKACLFLVMVEVFIVLLARNCNINTLLILWIIFMIRCLSYLNCISDIANKKYQILVHTITFNIIVFNQPE